MWINQPIRSLLTMFKGVEPPPRQLWRFTIFVPQVAIFIIAWHGLDVSFMSNQTVLLAISRRDFEQSTITSSPSDVDRGPLYSLKYISYEKLFMPFTWWRLITVTSGQLGDLEPSCGQISIGFLINYLDITQRYEEIICTMYDSMLSLIFCISQFSLKNSCL